VLQNYINKQQLRGTLIKPQTLQIWILESQHKEFVH